MVMVGGGLNTWACTQPAVVWLLVVVLADVLTRDHALLRLTRYASSACQWSPHLVIMYIWLWCDAVRNCGTRDCRATRNVLYTWHDLNLRPRLTWQTLYVSYCVSPSLLKGMFKGSSRFSLSTFIQWAIICEPWKYWKCNLGLWFLMDFAARIPYWFLLTEIP